MITLLAACLLLSWKDGGGAPSGPYTRSARMASHCEVLLDPGFKGSVRLYASPDKKKQVRLLRHNFAAEDWLYFIVKEETDSMFHVSAEYNIQGHIAEGWIDKRKEIGVYSRVYESGKSLVLFTSPKKGLVAARIRRYVKDLITVTACERGWVKVKISDNGKLVEGWMPPEEQCTNAYSTCN